jgi:hypothetical protein
VCTIQANPIDSLHTEKEVLEFARKHSRDSIFLFANIDKAPKEIRVAKWSKVDLDGNGLNDLMVDCNGSYDQLNFIKVFMAFPHGVLECNLYLDDEAYPHIYNRTIVLQYVNTPKKDTFVYSYKGFIKYNPNPTHKELDSIVLRTTTCFGTCPEFILKVTSNGSARYTPIQYNKENGDPHKNMEFLKSGGKAQEYKTVIDALHLHQMKSIIDYMNLNKLEKEYYTGVRDQPSAYLQVYLRNGTCISVKDYGQGGTDELKNLYRFLFDLRDNQAWKPITNR